jgi:hypothetical protein
MNGYSGSGGYGGPGGPAAAPPGENCSFAEFGKKVWDAVRAQDPEFYDAACSEAWQAASDKAMLDDLGQPSPSWWDTARIAVRGYKIEDEGAIAALTSDGSEITDWNKVSSPVFDTANGPAEIHAYQSTLTGAFNPYDFKIVFLSPF